MLSYCGLCRSQIFIKITTFRQLFLLPSSGLQYEIEIYYISSFTRTILKRLHTYMHAQVVFNQHFKKPTKFEKVRCNYKGILNDLDYSYIDSWQLSNLTHKFLSMYLFICSSLHVSSMSCSSSGETNCINTASGNCHSVLVAVSQPAHDTATNKE